MPNHYFYANLTRLVYIVCCIIIPFTVHSALPASVNGQDLPTLAPMLEQTTPGVVNIATRGRVKVASHPLLDDPFFRHFFGNPQRPRERTTQSLGSGVIVNADKGYILTNSHVIAGADKITVTLHDGREFDAVLIGSDPDSDVAVIQIDADNLRAVRWGNSDVLRVGDFVVAIGSPFGLAQTVTSGIVSALGRSGLGIEAYEDFIQTDASINPGNSGGALVNLNGELIGINTAILGPSGGNIGIGFAIPAHMAQQIMQQLLEYGEVRRGRLGVVVQDLNPELAKAFGIKQYRGAIISRVEGGSAADIAGLEAGDVVIEVNERPVKSSADMRNAIGLQRIGAVVEMTVLRDNKQRSIKAVIAEPKMTSIDGKKLHPRMAGARLGMVDDDTNSGLTILDIAPQSAAASSGLRKGDVILSINRRRVTDIASAEQAAKQTQRGILLNIQRGNNALFIVLQ